jgi:hypothetical protein
MYQRMLSDRREWIQRIHAQLFQQGCESVTGLTTEPGRRHLMEVALSLSPAGHRLVDESVGIIDELTGRIEQLRCDLGAIGRSQPGCAELQKLWGIGPLLAPIMRLSGILCKWRLDLGLALPALERKRHGRDPAGVVGRVVS